MNAISLAQFSSRHNQIYAITLVGLLALLLAPLFLSTVPPLLDYPIHLSRVYIYNNHNTNSFLGSMFNIDWRPLPNLGSDILLLLLTKFFSIELAGRLLLGLIITLTLIGTLVLHRVIFSTWSWWPLLAVFPAYHGALTAGFLNYSLGLSSMLIFLAAYIQLRKAHAFLSLSASVSFGIILYFCHIVSFGIFAIFLFGYEAFFQAQPSGRVKPYRQLVHAIIRVFPALLLPLLMYIHHSLMEVVARPSPMIIGEWSLSHKLRGIFMPIMSGDYFIDLIVLIFLSALFAVLFIGKKIVFNRGLIFGCLLIFLLFMLLPSHLLEAAFIMDRLPIAIVLVLLAATSVKDLHRHHAFGVAALVLILAIARVCSLGASWRESDIYYQRMASTLDKIEPGASVMIVSPFTRVQGKSLGFWHDVRMSAPNWHFALLNIPALHSAPILPLTKRSAFSQMHFVWPDKQVLSLSHEFAHLDYGDGGASTWHPSEIFLSPNVDRPRLAKTEPQHDNNGMGSHPLEISYSESDRPEALRQVILSDDAERFDYIILLYLDLIPHAVVEGIRQSFDYVDDDEFMVISTHNKVRPE